MEYDLLGWKYERWNNYDWCVANADRDEFNPFVPLNFDHLNGMSYIHNRPNKQIQQNIQMFVNDIRRTLIYIEMGEIATITDYIISKDKIKSVFICNKYFYVFFVSCTY